MLNWLKRLFRKPKFGPWEHGAFTYNQDGSVDVYLNGKKVSATMKKWVRTDNEAMMKRVLKGKK